MDCQTTCKPVVCVFCFCKCPLIAGGLPWECFHTKVMVVLEAGTKPSFAVLGLLLEHFSDCAVCRHSLIKQGCATICNCCHIEWQLQLLVAVGE